MAGRVELMAFPDHHRYGEKDMQKIGRRFEGLQGEKKIILTTEKDAMRLTGIYNFEPPFREKWYYMPIEVAVLQESERLDFENQVLRYVRDHKRNNGIHKK